MLTLHILRLPPHSCEVNERCLHYRGKCWFLCRQMLSNYSANATQVQWGEFSMVLAMRLLLRTALLNPMNQRFMYACEKTLPLYPASLVYQQLMGEGKSRVNACPMTVEQKNAVNPSASLFPTTSLSLPHEMTLLWHTNT